MRGVFEVTMNKGLNADRDRNNGIDFLRVLLALMVITLHYNSSLGQVQVNTRDLSFNWFFVWFTETLCISAVNIYVIISGYFSFKKNQPITHVVSKLKRLWFCLLFYSVMEYVVITALYGDGYNIRILIKRLLPVSTGEWWFFSVYFLIYMMSPVINSFVGDSEEKSHVIMLFSGIVGLCIIPQFLLWKDGLGIDNGYSLIWFIFLFFSGALLAKYSNSNLNSRLGNIIRRLERWKLTIFLGCFIALFGSKVFIAVVSNHLWGEVKYSGVLFSYNSIFVYIMAISLFCIFKNVNIRIQSISKMIRIVSPLALASYLFHCQLDFREKVWPKLACYKYANEAVLPLMCVITVLGLFVISALIELIRTSVVKNVSKLTKSRK